VDIWKPVQYLKFENERLRPALDLLAQINMAKPKIIKDLGCGTGNITKIMKDRWPDAQITGIDSSEAMLTQAKKVSRDITWEIADLNTWEAAETTDIIFSNATYHWLDNHDILFPKLMKSLNPDGILAIQMPNNFQAATHLCIAQVIRKGDWKLKLEGFLREQPVLTPDEYFGILANFSGSINMWETSYQHLLFGDNPVVEWTKGSALRPFLEKLDAANQDKFLDKYTELINHAYPQNNKGVTIMPFKRLFILATKK